MASRVVQHISKVGAMSLLGSATLAIGNGKTQQNQHFMENMPGNQAYIEETWWCATKDMSYTCPPQKVSDR